MKFSEYQEAARRTQNPALSPRDQLEHALWGLSAEVGEICAMHQKTHQGHAMDVVALSKEIGDVIWFLGELCDVYGLELGEVARQNIEKLRRRYPDGFKTERSINREASDT